MPLSPLCLMFALLLCAACAEQFPAGPALSKNEGTGKRVLRPGEHVPAVSELSASGALVARIDRTSARFSELKRCEDERIVFKDEERSGADRMMTAKLERRLLKLAEQVEREWPGINLRVTEAWDERGEHGPKSLHYEGRAADLTLSDLDPNKLARVAGLATEAGFDWVYFEDRSHVHVSVRR